MSGTNDGRIDYVEFGAADLPAVKGFYAAAFGWQFTDYGPDYASFEDGRLTGGFAKSSSTRPSALVVLYAVDLERTKARVESLGGRISADIFSFPGGRRFQFVDPAGNELAVWSDR